MKGSVVKIPVPRDSDVIEVALTEDRWTVIIGRPGHTPLTLAEFDSPDGAEAFARHVAEVRGTTDLIVRRPT